MCAVYATGFLCPSFLLEGDGVPGNLRRAGGTAAEQFCMCSSVTFVGLCVYMCVCMCEGVCMGNRVCVYISVWVCVVSSTLI